MLNTKRKISKLQEQTEGYLPKPTTSFLSCKGQVIVLAANLQDIHVIHNTGFSCCLFPASFQYVTSHSKTTALQPHLHSVRCVSGGDADIVLVALSCSSQQLSHGGSDSLGGGSKESGGRLSSFPGQGMETTGGGRLLGVIQLSVQSGQLVNSTLQFQIAASFLCLRWDNEIRCTTRTHRHTDTSVTPAYPFTSGGGEYEYKMKQLLQNFQENYGLALSLLKNLNGWCNILPRTVSRTEANQKTVQFENFVPHKNAWKAQIPAGLVKPYSHGLY